MEKEPEATPNIIRVIDSKFKANKKQYLIQWDSEPFFTWEKPEKEYKPYINCYEKTLKGTLTQFPCFFTRPSPSSLSIELNPEGTVTYFLGDKQIEEDNLTVEEKEAVLDELECIFYDEMVKTKIGDEYDL